MAPLVIFNPRCCKILATSLLVVFVLPNTKRHKKGKKFLMKL